MQRLIFLLFVITCTNINYIDASNNNKKKNEDGVSPKLNLAKQFITTVLQILGHI